MSRLEKYPKYKDSGVEWIGEIPEHWKITKLGLCLTPVSIKNRSDLPLLSVVREKGIILRDIEDQDSNHNFIPDDLSNYKMVEKGQFAMNKMKAWQGSYGVSDHTGIVSPAYYVFKLQHVKPDFFHLAIRSKSTYVPFFVQASDGVRIGQWDLSKTRMKEIPFYLPTEEEQDKIVKYIRDSNKKIDQAITLKEQLIEKLKERRQVLINDAVTKGLDPNVKMKESGVEWLGEVPLDWEVKRLKYIFKIRKRIAGKLGYDVLSITQQGIKIKDITSGEGQLSMDYSKYQLVYKNEFAMNHMDLLTGYVDISKYDGVISPDYRVFTLEHQNCSKEYFLYLLQMGYKNRIFYAYGQGVSMLGRWRFPSDNFYNFIMPVPPQKEQVEIIEYIKENTQKIDKAISLQQKQIEKLKEYKATIIDSLVTGKVRVS